MLGLSIPEEDAHVYAEGVRRGGILVVAQPSTEEEALQVSQIMHQHGALNINELRQDWQQSGWTHYRDPDESEEAPPLRSDLG